MMLPNSLTDLSIHGSPNLKCLSSTGFQRLTSLESLSIISCSQLTSFQEIGLPSSLLRLYINGCPLLEKQCKNDKRKECCKISHIPYIMIGGKFYDLKEEEGAQFDLRTEIICSEAFRFI